MGYFDKKAPTETVFEEGTTHEYVRMDHDAYGQLTIQRVPVNGPEVTLFESDLQHKEVVQLTLRRAHLDRRNYRSDVMEDDVIAQINLSSHQWAQVVSSSTIGNSVPVTLRHAPVRGTVAEGMPMIDTMSLQERQSRDIAEKFRKYMEDGQSILQEMLRLSESKGAVSKPELRELLSTMRGFIGGLPNNFAHMHEVMQTASTEMIAQAKTEIEAHVTSVANRAGLDHLRTQSPVSLPSAEEKNNA